MAVPFFDQAFEVDAAPAHAQWFGAAVTLKRGSDTSDSLTAVWYAEEYQALDYKTGLPIAFKKRTYILKKTDLILNAAQITPRQGDAIVDGDDELEIRPIEKKPAVESVEGGYRWRLRTNKLA